MKLDKENLVVKFLDEGYLVSSDILDSLSELEGRGIFFILVKKLNLEKGVVVINKDLINFLIHSKNKIDINWSEFDKSRVVLERGKSDKMYTTFLDLMGYNLFDDRKKIIDDIMEEIADPQHGEILVEEEKGAGDANVIILESIGEDSKKREIQDFVSYFRRRYDCIKRMLHDRQELQDSISISRVLKKRNNEFVSIIGMIAEKKITKNGNIMLTIEDLTGVVNILIKKEKDELFSECRDLVLDEVIGVNCVVGNKMLYLKELFLPDIPLSKELKKSPDEAYAVFIGDLHVGSNVFMLDEFMKFIEWLNGVSFNIRQREISKKVKYIFIVGDVVDGVGIYPGQEKDLKIKDIYKQYRLCAELLSKIPKHIKIIICGGNHDALRLSEPQPVLYKKFSEPLWELSNVIMVSNPSLVNIHSKKDFVGFNVLLYHGFSFTYYSEEVDSIRLRGGLSSVDLIIKFLLKRRHLAPSHSSTLYIPDNKRDPLVIDKVPDIFVSGHVHKSVVLNYRNVTALSCSCWISQTEYQEWRGIHPDPCKVSVLNLKTREVRIINFGK